MAWEKIVSQKDAVKTFLVTTDGKIDLDASVEKFRTVARQHAASQTAEGELVATCMSELFNFRKGTTLNLDYIKSQTVQLMTKKHPELNDPTLFAMLSGRVEDYLHDNCDQPAVEAAEAKGNRKAVEAQDAITDRTYAKKHGKGGGFYRKSDASPEAK